MRTLMGLVLLSIVFVGCQSKQADQSTVNPSDAVTQERKDASLKLTQESLSLLKQENLKDAVRGLDAAIRLDPSNQDAYLILGQILVKSGEYQRAVDLFDSAAHTLSDNGMIFYMLSFSNKMAGKKLPAALAGRRSFEIFKATNDKENAMKSAAMLQEIISMPDEPTANAK